MAKWKPSPLTRAQMEERRLSAAALFHRGLKQVVIAERLSVSEASVSRWRSAWQHRGKRRLKARASGHRFARLSEAEWRRTSALLRGEIPAGVRARTQPGRASLRLGQATDGECAAGIGHRTCRSRARKLPPLTASTSANPPFLSTCRLARYSSNVNLIRAPVRSSTGSIALRRTICGARWPHLFSCVDGRSERNPMSLSSWPSVPMTVAPLMSSSVTVGAPSSGW